jgi:hypothetical protein
MSPTNLRSHFILTVRTRHGYLQTMRFHLAEPIDFNDLPQEEKLAFMRYAIESYGTALDDFNQEARVEVAAFATETECRKAYAKLRGNKSGPAPRISGRN